MHGGGTTINVVANTYCLNLIKNQNNSRLAISGKPFLFLINEKKA